MKFQLILSIIIISKEKVIFAKKEPFKRNKEVFTCKEDLDDAIDSFIGNDLIQVRGDEENSFPNYQRIKGTQNILPQQNCNDNLCRNENIQDGTNDGTINIALKWILDQIKKIE